MSTQTKLRFTIGTKHTHAMITNRILRMVYASELKAVHHSADMHGPYWVGLQMGMESAFWAMQRMFNDYLLGTIQRS